MPPKSKSFCCAACLQDKGRECYTSTQLDKATKVCKECTTDSKAPVHNDFTCAKCNTLKSWDCFSDKQRRFKVKSCQVCLAKIKIDHKFCVDCGIEKPQTDFSTSQFKNLAAVCSQCALDRQVVAPHPRVMGAGPRTKECEHCGALLYQSETTKFCCQDGTRHPTPIDNPSGHPSAHQSLLNFH